MPPRRTARKPAKAENQLLANADSDNVVMMVLPPNIAEELAKSGGQLTPELLTAIAQSQESIKPVPLQIEAPDQEETLGSTTSIKVTNSVPVPHDINDDNSKKLHEYNESVPEITSEPEEPEKVESPRRVTRSSPQKGNKEPKVTPAAKKKRGGRQTKLSESAGETPSEPVIPAKQVKTPAAKGKGIRRSTKIEKSEIEKPTVSSSTVDLSVGDDAAKALQDGKNIFSSLNAKLVGESNERQSNGAEKANVKPDSEKSPTGSNSKVVPLNEVASVPILPSHHVAETVKVDALGITQEDLKQLDAVLATDQAKAILDNLPIDELLDPNQSIGNDSSGQTDVLDDLKSLMSLPEGNDFFAALDQYHSHADFLTPGQVVHMDHCYHLESKIKDTKKLIPEAASEEKNKSKRAVSPTRRSQRQQDKIVKEQADKIRAENIAASRKEMQEITLRNESSNDGCADELPESRNDKPQEETESAELSSDNVDISKNEDKEPLVKDSQTPKKKERKSSSSKNDEKPVPKPAKKPKQEDGGEEDQHRAVAPVVEEPKKDKKPPKKEKQSQIAYLSLEPALFSQPDVMVTKSNSEEKPKEEPKLGKVRRQSSGSADLLKKANQEAKGVKKAVENAPDKSKTNQETKSAKDVKKVVEHVSKGEDKHETLNDIIAEISGGSEVAKKLETVAPVSKPVSKKVGKLVTDDPDVKKRIAEDSCRKVYPKRENRRIPAHFEMYAQEILVVVEQKPTPSVDEQKEVEKEALVVVNIEPEKPIQEKKPESRKAIESQSSIADLLDEDDDDGEAASDISWCSEDDPEKIWCICRGPHDNRFMICCDKCEDWFHGSCVGVTKKDGNLMAEQGKNWFCPTCVKGKIVGVTDGTKASESTQKDEAKIKTVHKDAKRSPTKPELKLRRSSSELSDRHKADSEVVKRPVKKPRRKCLAAGCQFSKPGSNFCSEECIKKYSDDCVKLIKVSKEHRSMHGPSKDADSKDTISILDSKTGKLVPHGNCPTETNLYTWLREHQSCRVIRTKYIAPTPPPKKPKELVRKPSVSESPPVKKTVSESSIRSNVSKMLYDALEYRVNAESDVQMAPDEIKKLSDVIEKELYNYYKDVGMKYKSKCRSLVFNIKDTKNNGLFRKVIKAKIKPSKLVRMTTEEMASKELAEWREREAKHSIEMIKKEEEDRMKKVLKQQKLEKIEIFDEKTKDIDAVVEVEKLLKDAEKVAEKSKTKDTADDHKNHKSYDKNCSICTKKKKRNKKQKKSSISVPDKKSKEKIDKSSKHDKEKSSSSQKQSTSKPKESSSHSKTHKSRHSSSSKDKSTGSKKESKSKTPSSKPESKTENNLGLKVIKPVVKDGEKKTAPTSPDKPKPMANFYTSYTNAQKAPEASAAQVTSTNQNPKNEVAVKESTSSDNSTESKVRKVWKGSILMPDVTKFVAAAFQIHGPKKGLVSAPPPTIQVCGRIHPQQVYEYVSEIRSSPTRDIVVIQFVPGSEEGKPIFNSFYEYLNIRKRFGVVSSFSPSVKDFYIMPLASHDILPDVLKQIEGPGLKDDRPHTLLGILVVKAHKRSAPGSVHKTVKSNVGDKVSNHKEDGSYTPPLQKTKTNDHPSPVVNKNVSAYMDEPYEPSSTPPLGNDDANDPYSPTHVTMSENEDNEPYDPEENERDLRKLTELQKNLQLKDNMSQITPDEMRKLRDVVRNSSLSADSLKPSSDLDKQRLLLMELTKRVEEQRMSLEKQMSTSHIPGLSPPQQTPPIVSSIIAPIANTISIPANLAEILKNVKSKSNDVDGSKSSNNVNNGGVTDDPIVKNFAHYSPDDDYNTPAHKTPPINEDGIRTPPRNKPTNDSFTPTKSSSDPRNVSKSDKQTDNKISRKDPRQKSSLKNMTESELLERARKQLEEMEGATSSQTAIKPPVHPPQINTNVPPPGMHPPLAPPHMFPPSFAIPPPGMPPPIAQFPPRLDHPPPPSPQMPIMTDPSWNNQNARNEPRPDAYSGKQHGGMSNAILDYAHSDHASTSWDMLPPSMQKKVRKRRRQHEHWRGLKQQWQSQSKRYGKRDFHAPKHQNYDDDGYKSPPKRQKYDDKDDSNTGSRDSDGKGQSSSKFEEHAPESENKIS